MRFVELTEAAPDSTPVHFQIVQLDSQALVWIGVGLPKLGNLSLAMPTRFGENAVTTLIRGPTADDGASLARRLARRLGTSVAVSLNLPADAPATRAFAEQRVAEELARLAEERRQAGGAAAGVT